MSNIFIGDSVTDCDRITIPPNGHGWVNQIANSGLIANVINVGVLFDNDVTEPVK